MLRRKFKSPRCCKNELREVENSFSMPMIAYKMYLNSFTFEFLKHYFGVIF